MLFCAHATVSCDVIRLFYLMCPPRICALAKKDKMTPPSPSTRPQLRPLPNFIFMSRWLQLPLYLGLILAQCVYVYHFWVELLHLVQAAMGSATALSALITGLGYEQSPAAAAAASG
jgi:hypothetical protein